MADFNALEALINAHIKKNGVQAITGNILNGILRGMVSALGKGYTIAGVAVPSSDPGTMTGPLAYLAYTAGTYTHFGGLEVEQGEVAMLIYNEAVWHKEVLFSLAASATIDGNVGTPEVGVSFVDGLLTFDFRNMKGNPGDAAGFGTINATVDGNVGTPGVSVQSSGPDTAKNITFQFTNLKGETGVTSVVATVDNTVGTPSCTVSLVGQQLTLAFTGLKGAQGNTGVSADYPIAIINNLTTDDPASALSAAQGVVLDGKVSQLEAKVDGVQSNYESGYVLQRNGTISENSESFISGFIETTGGKYTTWNHGGTTYYLCEYDADKTTILDFWQGISGNVSRSFTTKANTKYLRATFLIAAKATASIVQDGQPIWTPVEKIEGLTEKIDNAQTDISFAADGVKSVSGKVADIEQSRYSDFSLSGFVYKATGGITQHQDYKHTDYIPCKGGERLFCNIYAASNACVAFYDENKVFIADSGINVTTEKAIITVPVGACFLRASNDVVTVAYPYLQRVSSPKSVEEIPDKGVPNLWEKYADNSDSDIDITIPNRSQYGFTRGDVYRMVKSIRLYGFDKTKKHTLYILWSDTNSFSFRISELSGGTWVSVFEYTLTSDYNPKQMFSFDYENNGKRVVALLDFGEYTLSGITFNALNGTPELIFAKTVYFGEEGGGAYSAGEGITIENGTISVDAETMPVPETVMEGQAPQYYVPTTAFSESGFISKANGALNTHSSYKATDYIAVKPGQNYKTNVTFYTNACIAFYNASKVYGGEHLEDFSEGTKIFTVPEGCYYMRMSCSDSPAQAVAYAELTNPDYKGLPELTQDIDNAFGYGRPHSAPIILYPQTKLPCVSFQFDDDDEKDADVVELFKEKGLVCAFAFIGNSSRINAYGALWLFISHRASPIRTGHFIVRRRLRPTTINAAPAPYGCIHSAGRSFPPVSSLKTCPLSRFPARQNGELCRALVRGRGVAPRFQ